MACDKKWSHAGLWADPLCVNEMYSVLQLGFVDYATVCYGAWVI